MSLHAVHLTWRDRLHQYGIELNSRIYTPDLTT